MAKYLKMSEFSTSVLPSSCLASGKDDYSLSVVRGILLLDTQQTYVHIRKLKLNTFVYCAGQSSPLGTLPPTMYDPLPLMKFSTWIDI